MNLKTDLSDCSKSYITTATATRICLWAIVALILSPALSAAPTAQTDGLNRLHSQVSIATQLTEVQRGTLDGRDFLTLHIGGRAVGPSSCRSNILRMDSSSDAGAKRQGEIETIALSAMLSADTVMIVVPLDVSQCVDGKPTFTDLYRLPADL